MAEKIIKVRLFTWFEETDSMVVPGTPVLTERIAHMGEKVDITNPFYVKRGEELNAFYTDDEAKEIEAGTYAGPDSEILFNARGGIRPASQVTAIEGEHGDVSSMNSEQLGDYIREQNLNVQETLALVPEDADEDVLNKFLDAEGLATENEPRKGVTGPLETRLTAVTAS